MIIKRRDFLKKAGAGAGLATLGACGGGESTAAAVDGGVSGPRVEWRLATSYPPSINILYGAAERLAEQVSAATGGNFTIRVYGPGKSYRLFKSWTASCRAQLNVGSHLGITILANTRRWLSTLPSPSGLIRASKYHGLPAEAGSS